MNETRTLFDSNSWKPSPHLAQLADKAWRPVSISMPVKPPLLVMTTEQKLEFLRQQKVGRYTLIPSPDLWRGPLPQLLTGNTWRAMIHMDYTASAQGLRCIEQYLGECLHTYANTHTETSATGRASTQRFQQAIEVMRQHVGAGEDSFVIPSGFGATGAIEKIQKILGLYLSPKGQKTIEQLLGIKLKDAMAKKVVVFVGPYEHHSNDVSWQDDALCSFVRIKALRTGPRRNQIDLEDLEQQLKHFEHYLKIGSFSAASNVTGLRCDLKPLGDVLHRHQALFFVDYAACGPYADIDMQRDGIDAIYLSVHKNLGGANIGFLIGRGHIYDLSSNPSFGGGGTVSAVTPWEYHFHASIEERETAGTPAIRQTWQAALSFLVKDWVGAAVIHTKDLELTCSMIDFIQHHPKLELLGNSDPEQRYPIFSFLVQHGNRKLHHTFVAVLLNDMFGIQARSGCACAGPFGHELLGIERELSGKFVQVILDILNGFKPGWTRIGTHYTLSDFELHYCQKAISAIAWFGPLFLGDYGFDPYTGDWIHQYPAIALSKLDFNMAMSAEQCGPQLPSLQSEDELQLVLQNQLEEFYLLAATQLARLILEEAEQRHMAPSLKLDELAALAYPLIKNQIEDRETTEAEFLRTLTREVCPRLAPPGKPWEECRLELETLLRGIIFAPESQLHRYEMFDAIDQRLHFFYVGRGRLLKAIELRSQENNCQPCQTR
jgi:selenocysteine lyase/cysteine desulfurase